MTGVGMRRAKGGAIDPPLDIDASDLSLPDVAKVAGMTESTFSRFFQKNSGRSFTDYLAELRIGRACRLLAETQQPVSGICYEVGYFNLSNFNRNFLKRRGMTRSRRVHSILRHSPTFLTRARVFGVRLQNLNGGRSFSCVDECVVEAYPAFSK
jgi:AraC-like DNA-binding protein